MQGCVANHIAHVAIFAGVQESANDFVGSVATIAARSGKRVSVSIRSFSRTNGRDGRWTTLHRELRHVRLPHELDRMAAPARGEAIIPSLACFLSPRSEARLIAKSFLDQPERLRPPGEEQVPKRSSPDRARDLLHAEEWDQRDKEDRANCQEA
jgi:hypothetical protein